MRKKIIQLIPDFYSGELYGTIQRTLVKSKRKQKLLRCIMEEHIFIFSPWSSKGDFQSFKSQVTLTQLQNLDLVNTMYFCNLILIDNRL